MLEQKASITGENDYLIHHLRRSFSRAKKVDLIVSFLMESGVKLIQQELKELRNRNVPIRILTGNYLNITQPSALYLLRDILGEEADIRFYNNPNRSFHAKTYFFDYGDERALYIGSSNLSRSALTDGIEWNFRLDEMTHPIEYADYYQTFEDLFYNQSIIVDDTELERYSKSWVKPKVTRLPLTQIEDEVAETDDYVTNLYEPRGAQIEALYELKKSREAGYDKGLVVAATGIGKTFLAAFDSKSFQKVLFLAHREEILEQAARSFNIVNPYKSVGFFKGTEKAFDADYTFASVQTLGKLEMLQQFERKTFDYIVVDECHHATARQYQLIMTYFNPSFMLGITATPQRLDRQDVLALFDYNLVYEANLVQAINHRWLVPFRYYGIYDQTINYDEIELKNGRYVTSQLEVALSINRRASLVLSHYKKFKTHRALGFCVSRQHADYMAHYFNEHGITSCAVHSGNSDVSLPRNEAISKLKKAELQVIFSVDMFNEGLDIKEVDMVLFLRPTESPTVFLQQLGRGLRLCEGKHYLNVLDFIGNFKKVTLLPFLLTGKPLSTKGGSSRQMIEMDGLPEACSVNFDFQLIDLVQQLERESMKLADLIVEQYELVKTELGHVPSRVEFMSHMDVNVYEMMRAQSKLNVFNDYVAFIARLGDLSDEEKTWVNTKAHEFVNLVERTAMSKMYKLPVLQSFLKQNQLRLSVTLEEVAESFELFYSKPTNAVDMKRDHATKAFKTWSATDYMKLAIANPIKFLTKTHSDFLSADAAGVYLTDELKPYLEIPSVIAHIQDAIYYREQKFYQERLKK